MKSHAFPCYTCRYQTTKCFKNSTELCFIVHLKDEYRQRGKDRHSTLVYFRKEVAENKTTNLARKTRKSLVDESENKNFSQ
jgi:hypothetical protein